MENIVEEIITFKLDYAAFNSAMTCVKKDPVRYYLGGVHIFIRDNKFIYEATDGHILVQIESKIKPTIKELDIIVPIEVLYDLKLFIKDHKINRECKNNLDSPFNITVNGNGKYISIYSTSATPNLITQRQLILDAQFPQTSRVIPNLDKTTGVTQYRLNAKLFTQLAKAFDIYFSTNDKMLQLTFPSDSMSPALAKFENFTGVIMPVRLMSGT